MIPGCGRGRRARAPGSPRRRVPATAAARSRGTAPGAAAWRRQRARGRGPSPHRSDGSRRAAQTRRVRRDPRQSHRAARSPLPSLSGAGCVRTDLPPALVEHPHRARKSLRWEARGRCRQGEGRRQKTCGKEANFQRVPSLLRRGDLLTAHCPAIMG